MQPPGLDVLRPQRPGHGLAAGAGARGGDPVFRFQWSAVLLDPAFWRWGAQFLRASASSDWGAKSSAYLRDVSKWSVALTRQVARDEGIDFHLRSDCGAMVTFLDDQASFDDAVAQGPSKDAAGVKMNVLDKAAVLKVNHLSEKADSTSKWKPNAHVNYPG